MRRVLRALHFHSGAAQPSKAKARPVAFLDLCLRALCPLPLPVVERVLGGIALVHALLNPNKRRRALSWATHYTASRLQRFRVALSVLFNDGRFIAMGASPAMTGPEALRRRVILRGLEYVEAERSGVGALLVGFHLGPIVTSAALCAAGYRVTTAGDTDYLAWPRPGPEWGSILQATHRFVRLSSDGGMVAALYRLRRLLLQGEILVIAADGRAGQEAFRIPVPGADLIVRRGWWGLRRQTQAATFPVLRHCEGGRMVVTIHPALPPPDPDPVRDLEACRQALAPVIEEYVQRFPEQCVSLALNDSNEGSSTLHRLLDKHQVGAREFR